MKIVFMGTPEFAVPSLVELIKSDNEVVGVFTQPDKPKGRGYKLQPPPIKEIAIENQIKVFQPKSLKDGEALNILTELSPDLIIVVAYGKILPKSILDFPKYGCINVHASLLPKYRGAAPIQWSVINGDKTTGVTTMYMAEGLDTGDILKKAELNIGENETSGELHNRLSELGAKLLIETINSLKNNSLLAEKQDDSKSCYAPMLNQDIATIDWNKDAHEIHNLIRGLNQWPVAKTFLENKKLKIYLSKISSNSNGTPGEIINLEPLTVACGNNTALTICELQLEGKKRMSSQDFLNGRRLELGMILGS